MDITISFTVPARFAPAFRSAVEEFSNELGSRLEAPYSFGREQAITDAVLCTGRLRAAVNKAIPKGDPLFARKD